MKNDPVNAPVNAPPMRMMPELQVHDQAIYDCTCVRTLRPGQTEEVQFNPECREHRVTPLDPYDEFYSSFRAVSNKQKEERALEIWNSPGPRREAGFVRYFRGRLR